MTSQVTAATLVIGARASLREVAIAQNIANTPTSSIAVILEGMPDGTSCLESSSTILISRIAPGCFCCIGNLTLRVTLNRILRCPPARLYISLAQVTHLDQLRLFLTEAPYDTLLALTADMLVSG